MLFKWKDFWVEIPPWTTSGMSGTSRDLTGGPGDVGDDMLSPSSPMSSPTSNLAGDDIGDVRDVTRSHGRSRGRWG